MTDFAQRVYDHSFHIDPIIRSLCDLDFYKLTTAQFAWEHYSNVGVSWRVTNRTKTFRLAEEIKIEDLRAQLDHARSLRFTETEIIILRGQSFYGKKGIFSEGFLNALRTFQLPEYSLGVGSDGQFDLTFSGPWWQSSLWEIFALSIINELRSRATMADMSRSTLDIVFARAKVKLYEKLELIAAGGVKNITDFGTRRRHSFLWQEHCVLTAKEVLGDAFTGTSNVHLAMKHGLEAKGSIPHEVTMTLAALANTDEELVQSQFDVLRKWQTMYHNNMLVFLPDTFGTTQFLANAPQWVANWTGARPDSKDPFIAGKELIDWWSNQGLTRDQVAKKLVIFSDGLDHVSINDLWEYFNGRITVGFGWGTNFTNDFRNTVPNDPTALSPISLVCKVDSVDGRPAVKLSDNTSKATGEPSEVYRYINVFGDGGVSKREVSV